MRLRPWIDDVPQGALERPASFTTGAVIVHQEKLSRDSLATDRAKNSVDPGEKPPTGWVPVSRSKREREAGVFVEAIRSKGKTTYRAIRTTDMDDDAPLPSIAYRTSKVAR